MTDGAGNVAFSSVLPVAATVGSFVTATATEATDGTSEFALNIVAVGPFVDLSLTKSVDDATPNVECRPSRETCAALRLCW